MMENVVFENASGDFFMPDQYGILLKSFTAPAPQPKVFRETIDGRDGDLDFTEYAGEVRYKDREITIGFRDMSGREFHRLMNFVNGQKMKIIYSETPDWYYLGRCEKMEQAEVRHVVDLQCSFICSPYMLAKVPTRVSTTVTTSATLRLKAARMSVMPSITVSAAMSLAYDGKTVVLDAAGTYQKPEIIITSMAKNLVATGSGTITVSWQDGMM